VTGDGPPTWRKDQRAALLAARREISSEERVSIAETVGAQLTGLISALGTTTIGVYWPINNEINLLRWARELAKSHGITLCLPVVVSPKEPLEFWRWTPGEQMKPGVWNIPMPVERNIVSPDFILAPLVGFDLDKFRLGYGGGYFDRTLASLDPRPIAIGVGFDFSALETIYPKPHDIPMDAIVTERRALLPPEWSAHVP